MKCVALRLVVGALAILGCTRIQDAWRFYATHCPEDGPSRERRLAIYLEPVDGAQYYERLRSTAQGMSVRELARVSGVGDSLPIYLIGPIGQLGGPRILVVAGVHGNEVAASLAAPRILEDVRLQPESYRSCELHVVAPANPVGLVHQSRYNGEGCDINRDFEPFQTPEARAIRSAFEAVAPAAVVALHEGPQEGFFLIATSAVPTAVPLAVIESLRSEGFALASHNHLGMQLEAAGYEREGPARNLLKRVLRLRTLGWFAAVRQVGTLTTQSPWGTRDIASRVEAQVAAVRATCSAAAGLPAGA